MEPTLSEVAQGGQMQNTGCSQKPEKEPPRIAEQNQSNLASKPEQSSLKDSASAQHLDIKKDENKVKEVSTTTKSVVSEPEKVSKNVESEKPTSKVCDIQNSFIDKQQQVFTEKSNFTKVVEKSFVEIDDDDVEPPGQVVEPKRTTHNDFNYQKGRLPFH